MLTSIILIAPDYIDSILHEINCVSHVDGDGASLGMAQVVDDDSNRNATCNTLQFWKTDLVSERHGNAAPCPAWWAVACRPLGGSTAARGAAHAHSGSWIVWVVWVLGEVWWSVGCAFVRVRPGIPSLCSTLPLLAFTFAPRWAPGLWVGLKMCWWPRQ